MAAVLCTSGTAHGRSVFRYNSSGAKGLSRSATRDLLLHTLVVQSADLNACSDMMR